MKIPKKNLDIVFVVAVVNRVNHIDGSQILGKIKPTTKWKVTVQSNTRKGQVKGIQKTSSSRLLILEMCLNYDNEPKCLLN